MIAQGMPLPPSAQTFLANYPSFFYVLVSSAAHKRGPAKSEKGLCVLPPSMLYLRGLYAHKVRSSPLITKKSIDLFCRFVPIHYLCNRRVTQIGKMSLLTSVKALLGFNFRSRHLGRGGPYNPVGKGCTLPRLRLPHLPADTSAVAQTLMN